ncbi:hypothetical protein [Ruegeria sp. EL01]|jgi:hypothetical protein|uniref:hypothetical protein n=1 Tax=Ruegeria sp. EL01 TaxID=2107578 RepID=UPI000EA80EFF|nr:hypothetical protein [Ruegeria sp. EL01]
MIPLVFLSNAAAAQSPLSGSEFDSYTRGKTLYYGNGGQVYGVERYLPNKRVIWSFLDGKCREGIWYQQGEQICFIYEDRLDPQCWVFTQSGGGLIAQFEGDPQAIELYEADDLGEDMVCYGPEVGV